MTNEEIHKICEKYNITNYIINDDGSIYVDGEKVVLKKFMGILFMFVIKDEEDEETYELYKTIRNMIERHKK